MKFANDKKKANKAIECRDNQFYASIQYQQDKTQSTKTIAKNKDEEEHTNKN